MGRGREAQLQLGENLIDLIQQVNDSSLCALVEVVHLLKLILISKHSVMKINLFSIRESNMATGHTRVIIQSACPTYFKQWTCLKIVHCVNKILYPVDSISDIWYFSEEKKEEEEDSIWPG